MPAIGSHHLRKMVSPAARSFIALNWPSILSAAKESADAGGMAIWAETQSDIPQPLERAASRLSRSVRVTVHDGSRASPWRAVHDVCVVVAQALAGGFCHDAPAFGDQPRSRDRDVVDAQQAGLCMWLAFGSNLQLQFGTELLNLNPPIVRACDFTPVQHTTLGPDLRSCASKQRKSS